MNTMKMIRFLLWVQATYFMLMALWPLIDISSFMVVTGYKTDIWLVKTVSVLLIAVSLCIFSHLFFDTDIRPAIVLASSSALALLIIDIYYAVTDVISNIYLVDGAIETAFLLTWIFVVVFRKRSVVRG